MRTLGCLFPNSGTSIDVRSLKTVACRELSVAYEEYGYGYPMGFSTTVSGYSLWRKAHLNFCLTVRVIWREMRVLLDVESMLWLQVDMSLVISITYLDSSDVVRQTSCILHAVISPKFMYQAASSMQFMGIRTLLNCPIWIWSLASLCSHVDSSSFPCVFLYRFHMGFLMA